jgi:hypothetical protein
MKREIQFLLLLAVVTLTGCEWHDDEGKSYSDHGFFVVKETNTTKPSILGNTSSSEIAKLKNDKVYVPKDTTLTIRPLENDTEGLILVDVEEGTSGTVVLEDETKLSYTPNEGQIGNDQVTYSAMDVDGNIFEAKIIVEIIE